MGAGGTSVFRHVWAWRTVLLLFLSPVIFLPIPLVLDSKAASCAYVILLMAVYWITESLPVGVTSLLPVVLFPMFGILSADNVAAEYMNDVNMLFMGGMVMAIAIEYWNLHKRVALRIMMFVGAEPRWLMMGMMTATWFLSMWVSNTATTAMMIPIAEAVIVQLKETNQARRQSEVKDTEIRLRSLSNGSTGVKNNNNLEQDRQIHDIKVTVEKQTSVQDKEPRDETKDEDDKDEEDYKRLCKGMSLSICYAANCGGIGSLTGAGPNLTLKTFTDRIYQMRGLRNPVTFTTWMGFGFPLSFLIVLVSWAWLQIAFVRCRGGKKRSKEDDGNRKSGICDVIKEEYNKLGPIVFGQAVIIVLFVILVLLWITRDLGEGAGWGHLFYPSVKDGAPAILVAILIFALPSTIPCLNSYKDPEHPSTRERANSFRSVDERLLKAGPMEIQPLLHWKVVHEKLPWHVLLLLGGGYAMSKGCETSGLSAWIGEQLVFLSHWNQWVVLLIICYVTAAATEVTSNTAIATLLLPIMSQLAIETNVHPLYYMFPTALACSFAFMLPVATPPNAIVFAYGRIRIIDMATAGLVMNIMAVPILIGVTATVGNAIFDFDSVPVEFINKTLAQSLSSI